MRTRIAVAELSPGQWDWLRRNLPQPRDFATDAIRMCVVFELEPGVEQHLELNPREFVGLMTRLHVVTRTVEVALAHQMNPKCDHGASMVGVTISGFAGGEPIRTYEDGCQSYGPYRSPDA